MQNYPVGKELIKFEMIQAHIVNFLLSLLDLFPHFKHIRCSS